MEKKKLAPSEGFYFVNQTRYFLLLVCTWALTMIVSNSLALNFTIICMTSEPKLDFDFDPVFMGHEALSTNHSGGIANAANVTKVVDRSMFSLAERSALFSATAVGTFIGTLPITYFTSNFGVRKMFTGYGMTSAIAMLLTPLAVSMGFVPLVLIRVLQGLAVATSFVAMGAISEEWSPLKNSGMYLAWLSCHLQFGPMLTMPLAGELCESRFGWPAVYYLLGFLSVVSFALFYYFFRDAPRFQRNVSEKELTKIEAGRTSTRREKGESQTIPYARMVKDMVVFGIIVSSAAAQIGFQIFYQYGPIYLNKALGMDVQKTGVSAALPFALSCLVKMLAGPLSDYVPLSDKGRVILFASISQYAMALCFAALAFLPASSDIWIQICFTGATVFSGLNCVGVVKCIQLAGREFSHVIMAWNTLLSSVIVLLLPLGVSLVAPENTLEQWGRIFIFITVMVIAATTLFNFTAEVAPRPWTDSGSAGKVFCVESEQIPNKKEIK